MKRDTWVVVSNSTCARIFKVDSGQTLTEIETFVNPNGHLKEQDFAADRPGRTYQRAFSGRSAMEPKTDFKQQEIQEFAKNLANYLDSARNQNLYDRIYLAASPSFLGYLRSEFTSFVNAKVEKEVSKDIVNLDPKELGSYFFV